MNNKDKYITIQELADLKGVSTRAIRMSRDKYVTREIIVRGGKSFEILLSSIELDLQEKYFEQKAQITSDSTALIPIVPVKNLPTKVNEIALARLDLLREWQKYRKHHPEGKTRAGVEFIESYNTSMLYPHIFKVLGKTSIGSVERWKRKLGNTTDYHLLLPKYEYATEFRTSLTDYEKQVFLKILLHPNKFCVGKAISITKQILSKEEPINVQDVTFRRYANWFRDNHYDIWTLARDGGKVLKDFKPNVYEHYVEDKYPEIYIETNFNKRIEILDKIIADYKTNVSKDLVILSCSSMKNTELHPFLNEFIIPKSPRNDYEKKEYRYKNETLFYTCGSFKGAEADAVILVDVDKKHFIDNEKKLIFYTGASRARFALAYICNFSKEDCCEIIKNVTDESIDEDLPVQVSLADAMGSNLGIIV